MQYCEAINKTKRRSTREVMIGNIGVGGNNPIRIQSMTTSNTRDVGATVDQIMKLADFGCEIARVTVQGMREADACEQIKNSLIAKGYTTPIVADIHFYPPAAMRVVDFVDKVRINPGNFADKRASFKIIEYDDASYADELIKIEEKFTPLVEKCKRLKRSMRIGTNHGSLSDRIMNRYGDTPQGMLESALEFARICRKNDFHDFVFSMKSSNPQVMVHAYRLLTAAMNQMEWNYPLHLGVTEAGQGEDGRIKSAIGIGTLLLDGIGETIRVSLTEDAWYEIDPCKRLVRFAQEYAANSGVRAFEETFRKFDAIQRRSVVFPQDVSMHRNGTVVVNITENELDKPEIYQRLGCTAQPGKLKLTASSADNIAMSNMPSHFSGLHTIKNLRELGIGLFCWEAGPHAVKILSFKEAKTEWHKQSKKRLFTLELAKADASALVIKVGDEPEEDWPVIEQISPAVIALSPSNNRLHKARQFFEWLQQKNIKIPVILNFAYNCSVDDLVIRASAECGALLCDGLGEGIWLEGPYDIETLRNLSFGILQAARMRMSKTDFISCPSCGRTLFDLQDVTQRIRSRTAHLPGVKIAIMGCIVNGPGEMADADFGYVGSKPGMIDLYIGKTCIEKDISFAEADDRLIELIKKEGRWHDPEL